MDKTRIEILADVIGCSSGFVQRYADNGKGNVSVTDALEAMKIAMKQSWFACANQDGQANYEMQMQMCDEYLNKLEEQK